MAVATYHLTWKTFLRPQDICGDMKSGSLVFTGRRVKFTYIGELVCLREQGHRRCGSWGAGHAWQPISARLPLGAHQTLRSRSSNISLTSFEASGAGWTFIALRTQHTLKYKEENDHPVTNHSHR